AVNRKLTIPSSGLLLRRKAGKRMGILTFSCPRTGQPIETGIETDEATLLETASVAMRVACPHCLEEHGPRVHEGFLASTTWIAVPYRASQASSAQAPPHKARPRREIRAE